MDIRVEREEDGTLSVYEAPPFSGSFRFVKRGPAADIITHYDVSGSMRTFFRYDLPPYNDLTIFHSSHKPNTI